MTNFLYWLFFGECGWLRAISTAVIAGATLAASDYFDAKNQVPLAMLTFLAALWLASVAIFQLVCDIGGRVLDALDDDTEKKVTNDD